MTQFLLSRPIAVIMSFLALLIFSVIAYLKLPVSLLPDIDVPQLAIKVNSPNTSPEAIEANVLAPIRESMATMDGLSKLKSLASNESGLVEMQFNYGTRMDLAYVEANEKIDRLMDRFPRDNPRPQVIRVNASDIPIARVHITPKEQNDMISASKLTENVLKKRLEQIEGLSLVDINGTVTEQIRVIPDRQKMKIYNLKDEDILQSIRSANQELGGIQVKDGQYQYFMRMASRLENIENIENIPIFLKGNQFLALKNIAGVKLSQKKESGSHLFNGSPSIVLNLHKQSSADMTSLLPKIEETLEVFRTDFPSIDFDITQDQSVFLNAGINNLLSSLFFGGLFAFAVLFIFMGNPKLPLIMGISIPSSLIISFLLFYVAGLSINIISLSGLALGLGMLIDNAIIVLENIDRKRAEGLGLLQACNEGVSEVRGALISSVLTTLAVFVPLIFLSGISGVLFFDQAVSVAIILTVSLAIAFILLPLLYKLFFNKELTKKQADSGFFRLIMKAFNKTHHRLFAYPLLAFFLMLIILPIGYFAYANLIVKSMPNISRNDLLLKVNWQEPISLTENADRLRWLYAQEKDHLVASDADVGVTDYLLQVTNSAIQESLVYMDFKDIQSKKEAGIHLEKLVKNKYPAATIAIEEAPNAFELLFQNDEAFLELRWRNKSTDPEKFNEVLLADFPLKSYDNGLSLTKESSVVLNINQQKLLQYGIGQEVVFEKLQHILSDYLITDLKSFTSVTPIVLSETNHNNFQGIIDNNHLTNKEGSNYPLANFISVSYDERPKYLLADGSGPYDNITVKDEDMMAGEPPENTIDTIRKWAKKQALLSEISGNYFNSRENLQELFYILIISVVLLYFILAAQFESFWQPLIVLFSLPFGISGALIFLWVGGASLNIMSAIGIVVMLGIMVNDAILKVDTINRNLKGKSVSRTELYEALHLTGIVRLKPILMTSITTLLALSPVLFFGGLGAELQRPLVLSVMGGLTIGTGTALFLVPIMYYFIKNRSFSAVK